jgi:cysteine-rich repeat protein
LCGNGVVDADSEECDDGNDSNNDSCLNSCKDNVCNDGFVNDGVEACDDGNTNNNDACLNDCTANTCGDGFVNTGVEACDDGNTSNQDACLNDCSANVCGDGFVNAGIEDCDDGASNSNTTPDACRTDCTLPACGDGVVDPSNGEQCDDGASNSDSTPDACRSDCSDPSCGDGVTDPGAGEECDSSDDAVCQAQGSACGGSCTCANECPSVGEAIVYAGTGEPCTSDSECGPGTCEGGRCRTRTRLDSGWTGIAHDAGVTDRIMVRAHLECGASAPCGVCEITGIDPSPGYCRCANDNRTQCFQPLAASDNDSCGGAACNCYLGPPLSLSAGNTPACVVNRIRDDISGTGNVDTGEGAITTNLASVAYLGINLTLPCPACGGTCSAPTAKVGAPCSVDADCDTQPASGDGDCSGFDSAAGDGQREGTCHGGVNEGLSCDVDAYNVSFPAPATPGEAGMSLDCFPDSGKNVSGSGLRISLTQTTGTSALPEANITCGFPPFVTYKCPCGQCSNDVSIPCSTNDQCPAGGTCVSDGNGLPLPDQCNTTGGCIDIGDGQGQCDGGPTDKLCDGILRANGNGFIACLSNADCDAGTIGLAAGSCTIVQTRKCFMDPITATGTPNPSAPVGVASFCIGKTSNGGINTVAGLPGPGRVITQTSTRTFCSSDTSVEYTPGVGGCP